MKTALSARVRDMCGFLGLDQAALAKATGIGTSQIGKIWHGKSEPGGDHLVRLAKALGTSAEFLLTGEHPAVAAPGLRVMEVRSLEGDDGYTGLAGGALAVPTAWLARFTSVRSDLWLVEMPNALLTSLAARGDLLVCQGPDRALVDGAVYIFTIGGSTLVRRVLRTTSGGVQLVADAANVPPLELQLDGFDGSGSFGIEARVVGAIRVVQA
ncbi:MAG: XRE family transcriptional regulator [Sandaracinobacter sp.]